MNYNTLNKQVKRKPRVLHTTRLQQSQCSFPFASGFAGWNGAVVTDKIRLRLKIKRIRRSPFHLWQANRMSQVPKLMRSSTKNTWGYGCIMQTESRQKGRGESMWVFFSKENPPRSGCGTSPNDGSSDTWVDSSHLDSRHICKQCNSHLPATAAGKATDDLCMLCHKKATGYDVHLLRCFICMKNASASHVGSFWSKKP